MTYSKLISYITNIFQRKLFILLLSFLCLCGCGSGISSDDPTLLRLQQAQAQLSFNLLAPQPPEGFAFGSATVSSTGFSGTEGIPPFINDNALHLQYENEVEEKIDIIQYQQPPNVGVGVPEGEGVRQIEIGGELFPMRVNTVMGITNRQIYYHRGDVQIMVSTTISPEALSNDDLVAMIESLQPIGQ